LIFQALQDEGLDPEEFYFDTCEKKGMKRNSVGSKLLIHAITLDEIVVLPL